MKQRTGVPFFPGCFLTSLIPTNHSPCRAVVAGCILLGSLALAACGGGGGGGGGGGDSPKPTYTVAGTISGLTASGLVLVNNGGDALTVAANATSFQFPTAIASGGSYGVSVRTQPGGQTCTVSNGSGTISANVTNVSVSCAAGRYTVGGSISGLTAAGLVLLDNGGDALTVPAAATSFQFATGLQSGSSYAVTIQSQPSGESCSLGGTGSGTVGTSNVTSVMISCGAVAASFSIGGTVSGLSGTGLVLQDNGGDDLPVSANGSFTFPTQLQSGQQYAVTVMGQPQSPVQHCAVTSATGTVPTSNVTGVQVTCRNPGQFILVTTTFGGADGVISVFQIDASTGQIVREQRDNAVDGAQPMGIQFDQNGFAYIAYQDTTIVSVGSLAAGPVFSEGSTIDNGLDTLTESMAVDPAAAFVYAGGVNSGVGAVFAYASGSGMLTHLAVASYPTDGNVFSLVVDPAGKFLYAPTGAGGKVDGFSIGSDGSLNALAGSPFVFQGGKGTNTPYAVAVYPTGGFLFFTDNTANTVTAYSYDASGALTQIGDPQAVGNGPQSVTVDPTGQFLYVANSGDGTVSGFSINATTGALAPMAGSPFTTNGGASMTPTAIQVEPSGAYAYVVNGDAATISSFSVDPLTGALTQIDPGDTPQSVIGDFGGNGSSNLAIE